MRTGIAVAAAAAALVAGGVSHPDSAKAVSDGFKSPTGNIVCFYQAPGGYEPVRLACQTLNDGFTATLRPTARARTSTQARWSGSGLRVLRYGRAWSGRPYRCVMRRTGVTCVSQRSGHAFVLSRDGFGRGRL